MFSNWSEWQTLGSVQCSVQCAVQWQLYSCTVHLLYEISSLNSPDWDISFQRLNLVLPDRPPALSDTRHAHHDIRNWLSYLISRDPDPANLDAITPETWHIRELSESQQSGCGMCWNAMSGARSADSRGQQTSHCPPLTPSHTPLLEVEKSWESKAWETLESRPPSLLPCCLHNSRPHHTSLSQCSLSAHTLLVTKIEFKLYSWITFPACIYLILNFGRI